MYSTLVVSAWGQVTINLVLSYPILSCECRKTLWFEGRLA